MATRIVFNGIEYASPDDMPPDVRFAYEQAMVRFEDRDRNGVPDVVEDAGTADIRVETHSRYVVNGREYRSLAEMPPDVRALLEQARSGDVPVRLPARNARGERPAVRISCGAMMAALMAAGFILLSALAGS